MAKSAVHVLVVYSQNIPRAHSSVFQPSTWRFLCGRHSILAPFKGPEVPLLSVSAQYKGQKTSGIQTLSFGTTCTEIHSSIAHDGSPAQQSVYHRTPLTSFSYSDSSSIESHSSLPSLISIWLVVEAVCSRACARGAGNQATNRFFPGFSKSLLKVSALHSAYGDARGLSKGRAGVPISSVEGSTENTESTRKIGCLVRCSECTAFTHMTRSLGFSEKY